MRFQIYLTVFPIKMVGILFLFGGYVSLLLMIMKYYTFAEGVVYHIPPGSTER